MFTKTKIIKIHLTLLHILEYLYGIKDLCFYHPINKSYNFFYRDKTETYMYIPFLPSGILELPSKSIEHRVSKYTSSNYNQVNSLSIIIRLERKITKPCRFNS
ncbi:hypothetical protein ISN45_At02g034560 [Arabidopsis thaliana x Arabidopsis arenosa]|uniref:Uncharacterized protein n=2 Tax=Arabidopsis TaxID=3701 RepID=A0A8T2G9Q9_ARASU|nr:hypothetical protein ISN45_At02g034560 [Arabidopsis thaliana x Arabidopsis arenosa]KAG7643690.1 hypothetical protein ISN44_As02g034730 [Arabidopsis suecica]